MCLVSTSVNLSNFNNEKNESIYLRWTSCAVIVEMLWISKIYDSSPSPLKPLLEVTQNLTHLSQKTSKFFVCNTKLVVLFHSPVKAFATSATRNVSQCVASWCSVLVVELGYCTLSLLWISIFSINYRLTFFTVFYIEIARWLDLVCDRLYAINFSKRYWELIC